MDSNSAETPASLNCSTHNDKSAFSHCGNPECVTQGKQILCTDCATNHPPEHRTVLADYIVSPKLTEEIEAKIKSQAEVFEPTLKANISISQEVETIFDNLEEDLFKTLLEARKLIRYKLQRNKKAEQLSQLKSELESLTKQNKDKSLSNEEYMKKFLEIYDVFSLLKRDDTDKPPESKPQEIIERLKAEIGRMLIAHQDFIIKVNSDYILTGDVVSAASKGKMEVRVFILESNRMVSLQVDPKNKIQDIIDSIADFMKLPPEETKKRGLFSGPKLLQSDSTFEENEINADDVVDFRSLDSHVTDFELKVALEGYKVSLIRLTLTPKTLIQDLIDQVADYMKLSFEDRIIRGLFFKDKYLDPKSTVDDNGIQANYTLTYKKSVHPNAIRLTIETEEEKSFIFIVQPTSTLRAINEEMAKLYGNYDYEFLDKNGNPYESGTDLHSLNIKDGAHLKCRKGVEKKAEANKTPESANNGVAAEGGSQ